MRLDLNSYCLEHKSNVFTILNKRPGDRKACDQERDTKSSIDIGMV